MDTNITAPTVDAPSSRGWIRTYGAGILLMLIAVAAAAVVIMPYVAPELSGAVRLTSLFGLLLAADLLLGAWLALRLQGRFLHGSRFTDDNPTGDGTPANRRMGWTEGLMIGGFVLLVLAIGLAGYIATSGVFG